jgi:hypothetical protein
MWQNQYNLTHLTIPESTRVLLPDLEAIELVVVKKQNEKLKVKGKATPAQPDVKINLKRMAFGGSSEQVPKKACSEKFSSIAKPTAAPTRCTILVTAIATSRMVSHLKQLQISPPSPRSPARSFGAIRVWPSCRPCLRLMQKPRKLVSSRNARSLRMTLVAVPTVNMEQGATARVLV